MFTCFFMLFFNFCFCSLQKQRSLVSPVEMCHDLLQGHQTAGCDLDQERLDGGICNKHFISIGQTKYLFSELSRRNTQYLSTLEPKALV